MSWYDDIWDYAVKAGNAVVDTVKENPFTVGGALIGASQNGLRGAATGAALGAGVDAWQTPGSYGSQIYNAFSGAPAPAGVDYSLGSARLGQSQAGLPGPSMSPADYSLGSGTIQGRGAEGLNVGYAPPEVTTQSSVTGNFGGYNPGGSAAEPNMFDRAATWGQNNSKLAGLGVQLAGMYIGNKRAGEANALQQQALDTYGRVAQKNEGVADAANSDAQRLSDVSWSNYNPQNMAVRAYAGAVGAGGRDLQRIEDAGYSANRSAASVNAEKRRAGLEASKNASTAFVNGYDTGAKMQNASLVAADGLRMNYGAPSGMMDAATAARTNANNDTASITGLLESYLGNPSAVNRKKRTTANGEVVT